MRFHWKDTLKRLTGAETRCPCCRADGLVTCERNERDVLPDLRGIPYCECPRCGERGEFPELVAQALAKGVEETVRTLHRSGELDAGTKEIETYVARKAAQAEVDSHLAACTERLRQAPHLGNVRAGLSASNLRQLPPDTGLHVRENAPRQFALLDAPRYQRANMTLYRYRFDGETTCIDVKNPRTLQREHRLRITGGASDVGTYLGDYRFGDVPQVVVATHDPRIAGQAYGSWRAETTLPSPVIGIAGFPLPNRFRAVVTLYLLDAPDNPLPLSLAVRALAGPVVYGTDEIPHIRVLTPRGPSSDITAADLRALSNSKTHGLALRDWLHEKLVSMADRREEVAVALLQSEASEPVRSDLACIAGPKAPKSLIDTITLPTRDPDDVISLANGRLIRVTPVGLWTARRVPKTGEVTSSSLLCNIGLTVDSRLSDRGSEVAVCTVTHQDADVPSVSVRIPKAHWNNPDAMAEDVRGAWSELGRTPYVAFYRSAGYAWSDIIQLLGSRCPVQTGIRQLGLTPEGNCNFPSFAVVRGSAVRQTKTGLLRSEVMSAWSAVDREFGPDDASGLAAFLCSRVSLVRTGVAAGVLHAAICASGTQYDRSGVRRPQSHLVFVETEPGVWDETLRTMAFLFSGSGYVPLMDYADRDGFLAMYSGLGTLPLVTRLPSADDMAAVLCGSPVPVIAVADPITALGLSGHGNVSFVLPHVEAGEDGVSPDELTALRRAFAAFVTAKAGTGWIDPSPGGALAGTSPVLSAASLVVPETAGGTVCGGLMRSVRSRYIGTGLTGAATFFAVMHREVTARLYGDTENIHVTIVNGVPENTLEASFNERGEHVFVAPEWVIVSRSVVSLLNREKQFLFDVEQLSREFTENGILLCDVTDQLGIDPRRVWVFSRAAWDERVVRAAGLTSKEKQR